MPTLFAFRLSTYLTLALACACLSYAEWDFLKQASIFGCLVIVFLVIAFLCEGRYELNLTSANRLGFGIGLAAALWLAYQFLNKNSLIYTFPWPTSLLPFLGPLLMVLMPAKLFRPKHIGDWWAMQGIGLATACLAAAMDDDAIFGVLLALYAICGVWSLSLFFYLRVGGLLAPVPLSDPGPPVTILASTIRVEETQFGRAFLIRSLGWVALSLALATPIFLLFPRSSSPRWAFGQQRVETGLTQENFSDLNQSGELRPSDEPAYDLVITDRQGATISGFSPEQRFRSLTFNAYENGRWVRIDTQPIMMNTSRLIRDDLLGAVLADFGREQIDITFSPKIQRVEPILADPVLWEPGKPSPIVTLFEGGLRPWLHGKDGLFRPFGVPVNRGFMLPYRQSIAVQSEPDLSPPWEPMTAYAPLGTYTDPDSLWHVYRHHRISKIKTFSRELITKLASADPNLDGALGRAVLLPEFQVQPLDFEMVSRAVCNYFATSPEYSYSLKLRRLDQKVDPIEEFIGRTKQGHCERFAAATALVLRSVGIPAAYVLGYKGCTEDEENKGHYLIRQEMAHAWVEVAVPRKAPADFQFRRKPVDTLNGDPVVWHWLSLDPTPASDAATTTDNNASFFSQPWTSFVNFFSDYIIGYNPDKRREAFQMLTQWFLGPIGQTLAWLSMLSMVVIAVLWYRQRRRRSQFISSGHAWFDDYRQLLDRTAQTKNHESTYAEHASAMSSKLGTPIPTQIVSAYYRAKYAGEVLDPKELSELHLWVSQLKPLHKRV